MICIGHWPRWLLHRLLLSLLSILQWYHTSILGLGSNEGQTNIFYAFFIPNVFKWRNNEPSEDVLFRPFTEFWVVSIEHLRRVWHADRGRLLLRTLGPVPLGLAYVLLVETNPFSNMSLFNRTMLFEYPSVLSRFCFVNWPQRIWWWVNINIFVGNP